MTRFQRIIAFAKDYGVAGWTVAAMLVAYIMLDNIGIL